MTNEILQERLDNLARIRATPGMAASLLAYYRDHIADMIDDWGVTYDPRLIEQGLPAVLPFKLFPKQRQFVDWFLERWMLSERGLCEKSRDMGVTWLVAAIYGCLAVTHEGIALGLGSRDEDSVDRSDDPSSIFWKIRFFLAALPGEFRGGFGPKDTTAHMRIRIPSTGSVIFGDAGKNIGRGARSAIYVVDEAAHLLHPKAADAALSATTNCRIDVSSVSGMANPFAERRWSGKIPVFTFHWRDDPRKDDAWYAKQCNELDPVTVASEIDINYSASVKGVLIPAPWVQAAIDLDKALGFEVSGRRKATLDVADEGGDANCWVGARGVRIERVEEWSGKGDDIFGTTSHAFRLCDDYGTDLLTFDSDGLGAGVRGDARVLNQPRRDRPNPTSPPIRTTPFRAGAGVSFPERPIPSAAPGELFVSGGRTNADYFRNMKAQAGWELRTRFQRAYRARQAGTLGKYHPDDLIVLAGDMPDLHKTVVELSQPTFSDENPSRKIEIDKKPDGTKSPNRYDGIMMHFAPIASTGYDVDDLRKALGQ